MMRVHGERADRREGKVWEKMKGMGKSRSWTDS